MTISAKGSPLKVTESGEDADRIAAAAQQRDVPLTVVRPADRRLNDLYVRAMP
jgi:hypothetical protein